MSTYAPLALAVLFALFSLWAVRTANQRFDVLWSQHLEYTARKEEEIRRLLDRIQARSFEDVVAAKALDLSLIPPPAPEPKLWADGTGLVVTEAEDG